MDRWKVIALLVLWVVLAWKVGDTIYDAEQMDRVFLARFALYAWLGGLVSLALILITRSYLERTYGPHIPQQIWFKLTPFKKDDTNAR